MWTYYLSNDNDNCIECPIQCSQCSYESVQQEKCIKCNNNRNYFEKYDLDDNSFVNCINEANKPNNLFLNKEQLRYEPCYETCKECFNFGNKKNNNCISCVKGYSMKEENPYNCILDCKYYYYYDEYGQYRCTESNISQTKCI